MWNSHRIGSNAPAGYFALGSLASFTLVGAAYAWYSYRGKPMKREDGQRSRKVYGLDSTKIFTASEHLNDGKHHLLLAATGSVATIKIPNIIQHFSERSDVSIRLVLTENAANFLAAQSGEQPSLYDISQMKNVDGIYLDEDEWKKPWIRGDSILHIELRRWADLMVIAPLSADSLAKIALGLSDNLVTSVVRAWDTTGLLDPARPGIKLPYGEKKGVIVAPAMNTAMWNNRPTMEYVEKLQTTCSTKEGGCFEMLRPVEKELACGDTGLGAMRDWREIVKIIEARLYLTE